MRANHRCAFPLLYLLVARERSFYVLVLRRRRHPTFSGQISEKLRHSRFCHLTRMPLIMKKNEPANPIHIGLFGPDAKMFAPNHVPNWSSNFGLFQAAWIGKVTAMSGIFASLMLEGKRIRPEKPVIKGGIFPPNSR